MYERFAPPTPKGCLFEYAYLARPDTTIAGRNVQAARVEVGRRLAREHPAEADLVIPVPESGTPSAIGYAEESGIPYGVGKFPHAASGRAVGIGRTEGFTKLIFDEHTERVIGAGIVGVHAGDLIAELALAIEMGCEASDIGHTIHPHPTLSESVAMAAEIQEGSITDLYLPKKK